MLPFMRDWTQVDRKPCHLISEVNIFISGSEMFFSRFSSTIGKGGDGYHLICIWMKKEICLSVGGEVCGVNGFGKVNRGLICTDSSTSEGGSCWLHHLKNDCSFHEAWSRVPLMSASATLEFCCECYWWMSSIHCMWVHLFLCFCFLYAAIPH